MRFSIALRVLNHPVPCLPGADGLDGLDDIQALGHVAEHLVQEVQADRWSAATPNQSTVPILDPHTCLDRKTE